MGVRFDALFVQTVSQNTKWMAFLHLATMCKPSSLFIFQAACGQDFGAKTKYAIVFPLTLRGHFSYFNTPRGLTNTNLACYVVVVKFGTYWKRMPFSSCRSHQFKQHISLRFSPHATRPLDERVSGFQLAANNDDEHNKSHQVSASVQCRGLAASSGETPMLSRTCHHLGSRGSFQILPLLSRPTDFRLLLRRRRSGFLIFTLKRCLGF